MSYPPVNKGERGAESTPQTNGPNGPGVSLEKPPAGPYSLTKRLSAAVPWAARWVSARPCHTPRFLVPVRENAVSVVNAPSTTHPEEVQRAEFFFSTQ